MAIVEIPTRCDLPAYDFKIDLESTVYTLRFRWNSRMSRWIMDIATEDGTDLLVGIPLHTNVDITSRFKKAGLPPGAFAVYDETGNGNNPDQFNFGTDVKLLYEEANG